MIRTLKDVLPSEFVHYQDTKAWEFRDVEVIEEKEFGWPVTGMEVLGNDRE